MTTTEKAIKLAEKKGLSLSTDLVDKKRIYKYSSDGFNWITFSGDLNQLIKFLS